MSRVSVKDSDIGRELEKLHSGRRRGGGREDKTRRKKRSRRRRRKNRKTKRWIREERSRKGEVAQWMKEK